MGKNSTLNKEDHINHYINSISIKCENEIKKIEKLEKIDENVVNIPSINSFNDIIKYNYNLSQLKSFAKHFELKRYFDKKPIAAKTPSKKQCLKFITFLSNIFQE